MLHNSAIVRSTFKLKRYKIQSTEINILTSSSLMFIHIEYSEKITQIIFEI